MQVNGSFIGTATKVDSITTQAGKSYKAFILESKSEGRQYPDRLKVVSTPDRGNHVTVGSLVAVFGTVSAEAYTGKDNTAKANLKMFANQVDVLGGKSESAPTPPIKPGTNPNPAPTDDNEIPF